MAFALSDLGWDRHFQTQVETCAAGAFARVAEVHRDRVVACTTESDFTLMLAGGCSTGDIAVGDWVRFDPDSSVLLDVLDRKTALSRKAPGTGGGEQLIAANVDTLFIVTSCNADFNPARLERYLALAAAAETMPVIVLTKADLSDQADAMRKQAERLSPLATAVLVNALDASSLDVLTAWLRAGDTGVLVGSSGVGKSTILNALTGSQLATQDIRQDDEKGRHTTTFRSLKPTLSGGWLIDTPGIRELALVDSAEAIDEVFTDVSELTQKCRFSNCTHEGDKGCAVHAAIDAGTLDPERLRRWRKLHREDRYNSETAEETRARHKSFSKQVRKAVDGKRGSKR